MGPLTLTGIGKCVKSIIQDFKETAIQRNSYLLLAMIKK